MAPRESTYIRWFDDVGLEDVSIVGGKTAALGEMRKALTSKGVPVPNGFAINTQAYQEFIKEAGLSESIAQLLVDCDIHDVGLVSSRAKALRDKIVHAQLPAMLRDDIVSAYRGLVSRSRRLDVAVRSSATAEDLPSASFAGQQESFLNVHGEEALLETCLRCYASLFTDRAVSYRQRLGISPQSVALSLAVQSMVRSDSGCSGVMFSIDTESGFKDAVLIHAVYGLGESLVKGRVVPDEYLVYKPLLTKDHRPILRRKVGSKQTKIVYAPNSEQLTKEIPVSVSEQRLLSLNDDEVMQLARWAVILEEHFSHKAGHWVPMDIEWAKDGETHELYILQARPETVYAHKDMRRRVRFRLAPTTEPILIGQSVGDKVGVGTVRVVTDVRDLTKVCHGEVLVASRTDPDWEPAMKKVSAIVTDQGGRTCHAAIVSREIGIPAVVGTEHATTSLKIGQTVTVSCAQGEKGYVYEGAVPFEKETIALQDVPQTQTQVLLNISDPSQALQLSFLPNDGVGLVRIEFILNHEIGIHPMALVHYDSLKDVSLKSQIEERTAGYIDKAQAFVNRLAEGVGTIAAAFYPKDVIVRFSDFKVNEYANLLGGALYEPQEENPMLGFRGALRYGHERYREAFSLECRAMKKVRDEMGLRNVKLMIPFCRTLQEAKQSLESLASHGLIRGEGGLEVYMMCEIPSNVILAEEFSQWFDGFSIGSNDLTQLTLGVDRDSPWVSSVFDERDPAVLRMIAQVIHTLKSKGKKIGICGQAPSDYPEFAEFVVNQRIDSVSLNPDSVLKTLYIIAQAEAGCQNQKARDGSV